MDEKILRAEHAKAADNFRKEEAEYYRVRGIYNAMSNLMRAHGLNPNEPLTDIEEKPKAESDPVSTTDLIRRAMPPSGTFSVDDVMKNGDFSRIGKAAVSLVLWKLAAKGEIKTVVKGARTRAASYSRT
jgi:hypothetical protein